MHSALSSRPVKQHPILAQSRILNVCNSKGYLQTQNDSILLSIVVMERRLCTLICAMFFCIFN